MRANLDGGRLFLGFLFGPIEINHLSKSGRQFKYNFLQEISKVEIHSLFCTAPKTNVGRHTRKKYVDLLRMRDRILSCLLDFLNSYIIPQTSTLLYLKFGVSTRVLRLTRPIQSTVTIFFDHEQTISKNQLLIVMYHCQRPLHCTKLLKYWRPLLSLIHI